MLLHYFKAFGARFTYHVNNSSAGKRHLEKNLLKVTYHTCVQLSLLYLHCLKAFSEFHWTSGGVDNIQDTNWLTHWLTPLLLLNFIRNVIYVGQYFLWSRALGFVATKSVRSCLLVMVFHICSPVVMISPSDRAGPVE